MMTNQSIRFGALLCCMALAGCGGGSGTPVDTQDDGASGSSGSGSGSNPNNSGNTGGTSGTSPGDGTASGSRTYGSPTDTQIRPGVQISSVDGSCTSNFIYYLNPQTYYIGVAAHCFSEDTNSGVDPCASGTQPIGSAITIENASRPGSLAYSSWNAMQQNGEQVGSNICEYNDFALVQIHEDDIDNVHPSAFVYGGPTALLQGRASVGDQTYSFGQSSFHLGVQTLQEKEGPIRSITPDGWFYTIEFDNAGTPGDSGSAVMHESGQALGVVSVVGVGVGIGVGSPVTNGVVNLDQALSYANSFLGENIQIETWQTFTP